jgi:chromosome segregation ATPase
LFILLNEIIMSTVESILQNGSHEKSFLQYPKCTVCGAYLVASDDCGYIKSDFLFEPCECIKSSALLGTYKDSNTKIVDKKGNEVKVAIKAKHILNLLSQEISTPGSFATNNSNVTKDSSMVNLINPNIHDAERAFLHFEANFSNKPLGSLIKQHEDRKEKELKVENELFTEEDEYNVNFKDSSALNTVYKKPTFKKFGISPAPAPVVTPLSPASLTPPTSLTSTIPPIGPTTGPTSGPSAGGSGSGSTSTPSGPTSSVTATEHEEIIKEVKVTLIEIDAQNNTSKDTVKEVKDLINEILAIDNKADVDAINAKLKEVTNVQKRLGTKLKDIANSMNNHKKVKAEVPKQRHADAAKVSANAAKKYADEAKQLADEAKQLAEAKKSEVERVKKEAEEKAKADAEKAKKEAEDLAKNIVELKKESSDLLDYCDKAITTIENNLNTASGSYTKASTFKNKINETDYSSKLDELSDKITKAKSELEDYKNKFNSASTILNSGTDDKDSLLKVKTTVADLKDELRNALKTVDEIMKESNELEREGSQKIKEKADAAEKLKTLKGEASTLLGDSKAIIGELEIILVDVDAKFNTIKTLSDDIDEEEFTNKVDDVENDIKKAKKEFEDHKTNFAELNEKLDSASDETEVTGVKDLAGDLKIELESTKKIVSDPIATELDKIATEGKGKASEKANQEAEKKKKEAEKKK